jgi:hypothetical protein
VEAEGAVGFVQPELKADFLRFQAVAGHAKAVPFDFEYPISAAALTFEGVAQLAARPWDEGRAEGKEAGLVGSDKCPAIEGRLQVEDFPVPIEKIEGHHHQATARVNGLFPLPEDFGCFQRLIGEGVYRHAVSLGQKRRGTAKE